MILLYLLVTEVNIVSNILRLSKLDFDLVKPYFKSLYLKMIVPIIFAAITQSLMSGISFAMFFISTTITTYIFSIVEKNSMERFYSVLPIKKNEEVIGRYIFMIIIGLISLVFYLISQSIVLIILGKSVSIYHFILSIFMGISFFTFCVVVQIPFYYKFGFIKGKIFIYIPALIFIISMMLFSFIDSPILLISLLIIFIVVSWVISILISIKILRNKEI